jgi:hypothetical protein
MAKKKRRCKVCHQPEQINAIGYTTVAPLLGICVTCLTRLMKGAS